MAPLARLAHALPGRKRIKIDEKRGDEAYFATVKEALADCPGVLAVEANGLTGSVVVHHIADDLPIWHHAAAKGLFHLGEKNSHAPPAAPLVAAKITANREAPVRNLKRTSRVGANWRPIIFMGLVGIGIAQVIEGKIAVPALTAFWYALNVLPIAHDYTNVERNLWGTEAEGRL